MRVIAAGPGNLPPGRAAQPGLTKPPVEPPPGAARPVTWTRTSDSWRRGCPHQHEPPVAKAVAHFETRRTKAITRPRQPELKPGRIGHGRRPPEAAVAQPEDRHSSASGCDQAGRPGPRTCSFRTCTNSVGARFLEPPALGGSVSVMGVAHLIWPYARLRQAVHIHTIVVGRHNESAIEYDREIDLFERKLYPPILGVPKYLDCFELFANALNPVAS